ncbi:MAG TPA: zinc ribbon domain-containing protein [Terriglobales bacterium]|nr:zinc ribbon domain-containing protein [Terriglobales bacterium]
MAGFCGNCGSPIAAGVKYCSNCGAALPGPSVAPGTPATPSSEPPVATGAAISTPTPASHGSNTAVKIVLIVVAVVVFLMLVAGAGCFYLAYRVKQKAHEYSQQMGGDATPYTGKRDPCLVSAAEVAAILGQPVQAAEPRGDMACEYPYGRAANQRLDVGFTWKGGAMTMKFAHGAMQHISGMDTFTAVPGIGDEAYVAPGGSGFMMRKGDVMVSMDLRTSGVSVNDAEKIAAKIADRL